MIALCGRDPGSTDGVRDYCHRLGEAFVQSGRNLQILRVPWTQRGWLPALWWTWRQARSWRGRWVLLQYTAFSWSRSGLPVPVLLIAAAVRSQGARLAVIYHDPLPHHTLGVVGWLRSRVQRSVMRGLYHCSEQCVLTVPLEAAAWLPDRQKAATIPVGSNVTPFNAKPRVRGPNFSERLVAVFGVTGDGRAAAEVRQIARAVDFARRRTPQIKLTFLGCGTAEAEPEIRAQLRGVPTEVLGVIDAPRAKEILEKSDALLFVRGPVASGRTTAVAGVTAGTPVIGFEGLTTGPPITEAGVRLVPEGRVDLLGLALAEVLEHGSLWSQLHERNVDATESHFSWGAIATRLLNVLGS